MTYSELLSELNGMAEEKFASFQRKLIPTKATILGVRTPAMRRIAKRLKGNEAELFSYPNEFYEVAFIKLSAVSALPYEEFCGYAERCVALMDNWAICDSFKADCLKKRRDEFLPELEKLFSHGGEFYERYVLVTLLGYYAEEKYLPTIRGYLRRADTEKYYVHMAAAWLTAEILVRYFDEGIDLLESGILPPKTRNKAIQKARESDRLNDERKGFLLSLKIKNA